MGTGGGLHPERWRHRGPGPGKVVSRLAMPPRGEGGRAEGLGTVLLTMGKDWLEEGKPGQLCTPRLGSDVPTTVPAHRETKPALKEQRVQTQPEC